MISILFTYKSAINESMIAWPDENSTWIIVHEKMTPFQNAFI
jgi:hypothetical protein